MRIYTKTGDEGQTGLFNGSRVAKEDLRVQAYGCCDELNSWVGVIRAEGVNADSDQELAEIQHDLFEIGSILATPGESPQVKQVPGRTKALENWMDRMDAALPALKSFILPGGSKAAAHCHVARTVARRAERQAWICARQHPVASEVLIYLNRLSDTLFLLGRWLNHSSNTADVEWQPRDSDS
ncbi:MAG: ATP:cob(I)alamin adenosyltransferase [Planctomycetota bacterium]|nr:MAG: ATP:cob(I)alamin adenosyltransferase [Planctomycetota bacterium]